MNSETVSVSERYAVTWYQYQGQTTVNVHFSNYIRQLTGTLRMFFFLNSSHVAKYLTV